MHSERQKNKTHMFPSDCEEPQHDNNVAQGVDRIVLNHGYKSEQTDHMGFEPKNILNAG